MTLIVPIGPPGCGKSTLVGRLVDVGWLDPDAVVSPDQYRRILTGSHASQETNGVVFGICRNITTHRLMRGLDVFYDATNLLPSWRADILDIAQRYNQPVMFILFTANNAECAERNRVRELPVPEPVMEQMFTYRRTITSDSLDGHVVTDLQFLEDLTWSFPLPERISP